jgi:hypothetical protein
MVRGLFGLGVVAGLLALFGACSSNGAVGVDTCKTIENALCANAPRCGVSLEGTPVHSSVLSAVDACQQFYQVACLHGLVTTSAPDSTQVQACVNAINQNACDNGNLILNPQLNPSCSFLAPPVVVVVDSGTAETSTDAAADATDDVVSDDSGLIIISP